MLLALINSPGIYYIYAGLLLTYVALTGMYFLATKDVR